MRTATPAAAPKPAAPLGRSIVAGAPVEVSNSGSDLHFHAFDPVKGAPLPVRYTAATAEQVNAAAVQAWEAFHAMLARSAADRAKLLEAIADRILGIGDELIGVASDETGLGPVRLVSERERTVNTLRLFADLIRAGDWVQAAIDLGQPSRRPLPKPDLRRMLRPLGPVAVFGAGNFPLAYSTAGGDTASALAAGCPVIVKGHPGHPGTGELVAQAVAAAVAECRFHPGTFSFLHAGGSRERDVGQELITHPCVRAAGFTGSVAGGTALARLAADRSDPIPVFAEMGSVNPVFILPDAMDTLAKTIADRLLASMTAANGQMCTSPGLIFAVRGDGAEAAMRQIAEALNTAAPQPMLNARTRSIFVRRVAEVAAIPGVEIRGGSVQAGHRDDAPDAPADGPIRSSAVLFRTTFETFRRNPTLREEIFGPAAIFVVCDDTAQLTEAAAAIQGSLTGTVWATGADATPARALQVVLEQRVGRLIFNGVPTGVEVCSAMVHGGPFPATNQPASTAVGRFAIVRWCRPVAYQNAPEPLLPMELRNANPLGIRRMVNDRWTDAGL